VETSWSTAEERLIAEAMKAGLTRIEAIRGLRTRWFIGESRPPGWKPSRPMPRENPRAHGQTVGIRRRTAQMPQRGLVSWAERRLHGRARG